jgi:hypothetical protein
MDWMSHVRTKFVLKWSAYVDKRIQWDACLLAFAFINRFQMCVVLVLVIDISIMILRFIMLSHELKCVAWKYLRRTSHAAFMVKHSYETNRDWNPNLLPFPYLYSNFRMLTEILHRTGLRISFQDLIFLVWALQRVIYSSLADVSSASMGEVAGEFNFLQTRCWNKEYEIVKACAIYFDSFRKLPSN